MDTGRSLSSISLRQMNRRLFNRRLSNHSVHYLGPHTRVLEGRKAMPEKGEALMQNPVIENPVRSEKVLVFAAKSYFR